MKTCKQIDVWGNVVVLLVSMLISLDLYNSLHFVFIYCCIGFWQLMSIVIHILFHKKITTSRLRKWYAGFVFILLAIAGVIWYSKANPSMNRFNSFVVNYNIFFLYFMGIASPVLAFIYYLICLRETYFKTKKIFNNENV